MEKIQGRTFQADRAWSGPSIMTLPDATVKLRWTDAPFRWHTNEGQEVFVVLDGTVDMHVRRPGAVEQVITLEPGDILHIREGEEHMAHPRGQARILVIERAAST
ncbi:cupin domain-containing protein [Archangium minus]|uniref:Cupin domain-containing protein n=1 Tax=Archangium minus TaxID=83450 RepID=A0ABY9WKL1_9BACT|nr:cupin domain-containing protein [Archangium minus]